MQGVAFLTEVLRERRLPGDRGSTLVRATHPPRGVLALAGVTREPPADPHRLLQPSVRG